MAWTKDPKIRELVIYAKSHGFVAVVAICIRDDGQFEVLSAGDDAANCAKIKPAGDKIFDKICCGDIYLPPY